MSNFREHSRQNWASSGTVEHINAGSLQRIADAAEAMAQRHTELISERDLYKRWYEEGQKRERRADRRIASLKGVITRMRKVKA